MRVQEIEELCRELAEEIRNLVRPRLGMKASRSMEGRGASGDSTFSIDEEAESLVEARLGDYPRVAFFSEDRGLVGEEGAEWVLVVDPIDGTRPAAAGLEACCVSVAAAPLRRGERESAVLGDVVYGLVREIKNDARFEARRGGGATMYLEGERKEMVIHPHHDISTLFWTLGFRGRPALPTVLVLEELIDTSSVDGGLFDLGSATFCITRLLTGQLDAYVDVGDRMLREVPELEEMFLRVGHGHPLNNSSYDLAAAALIAREAGLVITDAFGNPLEGYPLLLSGRAGQLSCVAAVCADLHAAILQCIERGMIRMRAHYGW
ncbi:inositol monophosphatase family protein [Candidatus Solincola sp.]|nr:inositol monophosphatase family protein [Actinomycetota bacterium]MDI7250935.1 inositol monophosphatase family protein [Actinomycetota bacterium]